MFQSTRPHGARPRRAAVATRTTRVSIHAPARGATAETGNVVKLPRFQSTRPHGARPTRALVAARHTSFNPRARTGRDDGDHRYHDHGAVSIHAPARGATSHATRPITVSSRFNPRARTGRDVPTPSGAYQLQVSIHAPARGATLNICSTSLFLYRVSIHAPARGATSPSSSAAPSSRRFNPRARTGRDRR